MSYQDNVKAAAAALKRGEDANWELARLTFESTWDRTGTWDEQDAAGKVSMDQWCSDVRDAAGRKFGRTWGFTYKAVWAKYGVHDHDHLPEFSEAIVTIKPENSRAASYERVVEREVFAATPEIKREAFARLAQDPEVLADKGISKTVFSEIARQNPAAVQQAWQDTDTNVALSEARWQAHQEQIVRPAREARATFEPTDTTLDRTSFFYDIQRKVDQWARELEGIREFLANTDDVNLVTRKATRSSFDLLIHAAEQCREAIPVQRASDEDVEVTPRRRRVLAG